MELKSKVQELEMLEIEIPALVETKEGKLLGGFCMFLQCRMVVKMVVKMAVIIVASMVLVRAVARMLVKTNVSLVVRSLLLRPRTRHRLHQPNL